MCIDYTHSLTHSTSSCQMSEMTGNRRRVFLSRHMCYLRSDNLFMYLLITDFIFIFLIVP